jgi:hypothetical protein
VRRDALAEHVVEDHGGVGAEHRALERQQVLVVQLGPQQRHVALHVPVAEVGQVEGGDRADDDEQSPPRPALAGDEDDPLAQAVPLAV